jgi:tetratricopeptide (TPR) repeat protein
MKFLLSLTILLFSLPVIAEAQSEPPHGMGELEAYSVFVDAYRTDDYEMAINFGEWMIEARVTEIEGYDGFSLERTFQRMTEVYVAAAGQEQDPAEITNHLESAEDTFEAVFETFDEGEFEEFNWYLRMGRFYHENHEKMDATMDNAITSYEKLYELDPKRFSDEGDGFFARVLLMDYASKGENERAFELIDEVEQYASVDLQETIDEVRESMFDGPEERIEFIESRLAEAGGSEKQEMLEDLIDLYEETAQSGKASETALKLYEMDVNFVNTKKVADLYLSDGNYSEALNFLIEAERLIENEDERKEILLEIAETHQQLENLESARDYTRQSIEIDGNWGAAYIRMSSIYATSISQCTGGNTLERSDRTVYWLVLDYLEKAREADPDLASEAENRAKSYEEATPSSEDKFFSDWEEGDSFMINGDVDQCYAWINEETTVR